MDNNTGTKRQAAGMDSEEQREIEECKATGKSPTDEGPYYHESWWESYKGGVKGTLGGIVIGAAVGALVGVPIAGIAALALPEITLGTASAIVAAVAGFGMLEAVHKFSAVGVVTGAVAAAQEKAEVRMKEFEGGKFADLKREIKAIKAAVTGNKADQLEAAVAAVEAEAANTPAPEYRTSHCDNHACTLKQKVFWNIAAIGAAVGAGTGALLGFGALGDATAGHVFGSLLGEGAAHGAGHVAEHGAKAATATLGNIGAGALLTTTGAAIGASFGINRDLFRNVFDTTDRLFKGILPGEEATLAQGKSVETPAPAKAAPEIREPARSVAEEPVKSTETVLVAFDPFMEKSATFYQDRHPMNPVTARRALLTFDPAGASRN